MNYLSGSRALNVPEWTTHSGRAFGSHEQRKRFFRFQRYVIDVIEVKVAIRKIDFVIRVMAKIIVCTNLRTMANQPSCAGRGSEKLADYLEQEARNRGLPIVVERSICFGHCPKGPNFKPLGEAFIHEATIEKLDEWLDRFERRHKGEVN